MKTTAVSAAVLMVGTVLVAGAGCAQHRGFVQTELKPEAGQPLPTLLKAEAANARERQLIPIVEVTATWCGPCRQLKASMDDPLMKDAFDGTYVIHLDHDAWRPHFADAGMQAIPVPAFFRLDGDGKPVARIDGGAWAENIPKNMAPPLKKFFNE